VVDLVEKAGRVYLLEIIGLTKYYGKKLAISDVNLYVDSGEIVGFVGPNGAGKTTTMRTVMGYLKPSNGKIFLFGEEVTRNNLHGLIKDVGYVPGEVNYYPDVTVKKILDFYASFYPDFDKDYCEKLCSNFDIPLNKKFEELSLGNKKKVSIIQSLAHKPKLLILDEPTNALDPFIQKKLYNVLEELKQQGVGILLSSHVLNEVERLCDRVIFIREGKIVFPKVFRKSLKKVTLINGIFDESVFKNYNEIVDLKRNNSDITIFFDGDVKRLIDLLNKVECSDVLIEDLSLEDVFEKLYQS